MTNAATATTPAAASPVPTVSSAVTIDWGDWVAQALAAATPIAEAAAAGGEALLLKNIPFGSILETFIGPQVINQYIQQGLALLTTELKGQKLTASGALETYVFNALNQFEPTLAAELGSQLAPLIKAGLAKVGITT